MRSQRFVFSAIAAVLIFSATTLLPEAAASAAASSGTVALSSTTAGAVQTLGVKLIGVTRSGGSSGAASVLCTTANGTAGAGTDFTAVSSVLQWASGDASEKYCHVTISDAHPFSGEKTFVVKLSAASGAALGTPAAATVTIYGVNNAVGRVTLSAPTYTVAQNAGSLTVTVDRGSGSRGWAAVSFATANGTAVSGTDYTSEHGTVSWQNGDATPKTFSIPISNAKPFAGTKTIAVAIAGAQGALLGTTNTSAIVTIKGDGAAAAVSGSATLSWAAPTTNTSGGPVTSLSGYNIHYGKSSTSMPYVIEVNNPATLSYVISNLAAGTWYFAVVAYNSQAEESNMSNTVSKTI